MELAGEAIGQAGCGGAWGNHTDRFDQTQAGTWRHAVRMLLLMAKWSGWHRATWRQNSAEWFMWRV